MLRLFVVAALSPLLMAQSLPENCRGFIEQSCCCTNNCCFEISEKEVQPMPNDSWLVKSTGQVIKRTAWSPDGKYYRCACDDSGAKSAGEGVRYVVHQGAWTRCLYIPPNLW